MPNSGQNPPPPARSQPAAPESDLRLKVEVFQLLETLAADEAEHNLWQRLDREVLGLVRKILLLKRRIQKA